MGRDAVSKVDVFGSNPLIGNFYYLHLNASEIFKIWERGQNKGKNIFNINKISWQVIYWMMKASFNRLKSVRNWWAKMWAIVGRTVASNTWKLIQVQIQVLGNLFTPKLNRKGGKQIISWFIFETSLPYLSSKDFTRWGAEFCFRFENDFSLSENFYFFFSKLTLIRPAVWPDGKFIFSFYG